VTAALIVSENSIGMCASCRAFQVDTRRAAQMARQVSWGFSFFVPFLRESLSLVGGSSISVAVLREER